MNIDDSAGKIIHEADDARGWDELRTTGLLWLINTSLLHPRGYALALGYEGDGTDPGKCSGWRIVGDGSEPWQMGCDEETKAVIEERFAALKELLP